MKFLHLSNVSVEGSNQSWPCRAWCLMAVGRTPREKWKRKRSASKHFWGHLRFLSFSPRVFLWFWFLKTHKSLLASATQVWTSEGISIFVIVIVDFARISNRTRSFLWRLKREIRSCSSGNIASETLFRSAGGSEYFSHVCVCMCECVAV